MKIGIIGAGNVGRSLGGGLSSAGHDILYAVRDVSGAKADELRALGAAAVTPREAVENADVIILATPWAATEEAIESGGDFGGKPLIDATNPIGPGFTLTHGHTDSGAEQVQRWAPTARVVKAFNTTGRENMADPKYPTTPLTMFVCGDDEGACEIARSLCVDVGFEAIPVGALSTARLLEPFAMLWIKLAMPLGHGRDVGFALLRR